MCSDCSWILQAGADAADELVGDVLRIPIQKGLNPLKHAQFVTLVRRIARKLRAEAAPLEQDTAEKAAQILDANWPDLSKSARAAKLKEVEKLLLATAERELPSLQVVFNAAAEQVIPPTRKALAAQFGRTISASLTDRDERTMEYVRSTSGLFVRDNYGKVAEGLSAKARDIVATGLESGLGREDISADLALAMKAARRPDSYWGMIANVFSNRGRSATQFHAFDDAGIRAYVWASVLDEVTSEMCRFLNGKTFPVADAVKRVEKVQQSDPEDIVDLMPWVAKGKNEEGQDILYYKKGDRRHTVAVVEEPGEGERDKIGKYSQAMAEDALAKAGLAYPPIHGGCRSTVTAVV